jgi:hypothetical protein
MPASGADPSNDSRPQSDGPRGEAAWQAARREVADRNTEARKRGKQQRKEHDARTASRRLAARDPDGPPQRP